MTQNAHISNVIEANDTKDRYDAEAKKILSDKTVLSWIMQYTMEEFKGYPIPVIRNCIEGTPEVSKLPVRPGHTPEAITGIQTEDKVPGEGEVRYDVRFYVTTPTKNRIKIIVNVEAQNSYTKLGYDIVTRGVFYGARMLSAQLDTEFSLPHYNDVKKVYSIWICMNAPDYAAYTISRYHMCKEDLYGILTQEPRYDLMEVITVCLGKESEKSRGNRLHGMLSTLFSKTLKPAEKKTILSRDYEIETSVKMEGGMQTMCNLSQGIEDAALEKGLSSLVHSLKKFVPDFDALYAAVIQNEPYKDVTKEEVRKYY